MRILIAEDDPVSRLVLEATLTKWGHEVIATTTGGEAWEALQAPDPPRLVVLDWMMPVMDGPDVCRKMRQMSGGEYFYIVMLTAKSLIEDVVEGLDAGADDYLVKPFDKRELRMRIGSGQRIIELQKQLIAAHDQLTHQATHDGLTGLSNRAAIFEALDRERARARRQSAPLAVVMVDLDHFKAVNDTHGHAAGDAVLTKAAQRMVDTCRAYDVVGRYGGEEFLIILAPSTDSDEAGGLAERLRRTIAETPFEVPDGSQLTVTASLGVASTDRIDQASSDHLVHIADEALYAAKDAGRNRVVVASRDSVRA
ncbi:MAG: diguanylate cyclase [Planctomycetes bacterium]|nr:diguanylate cyclase [Planctomycetota bacterium]